MDLCGLIQIKKEERKELKGSVKEPNISIYFSALHSVVFYFQCSVYWWNITRIRF